MYQQGDTRPMPWSDRLLLWTLTFLLLFTPLAFGAVEVWSTALAELLVLFTGVIWVARMIRDGRIQLERTSFNAPILLILFLMLFQMFPFPLARMVGDYLRFGSDFNTFEEVFPAYKISTMQAIFQYAHNDHLQLLAESGIAAFGLVV